MKKILKSRLFMFILGGLIFGSIGVYAATLYNSEQVTYEGANGTTNVKEALDDLFDNLSNNIEFQTFTKFYPQPDHVNDIQNNIMHLSKGKHIVIAKLKAYAVGSLSNLQLLFGDEIVYQTQSSLNKGIFHFGANYEGRWQAVFEIELENDCDVTAIITINYPLDSEVEIYAL